MKIVGYTTGSAKLSSCEQSNVGVTSWTNITSLPTTVFSQENLPSTSASTSTMAQESLPSSSGSLGPIPKESLNQLFEKFEINWSKIPEGGMDGGKKGGPIGKLLHTFVQAVIYDMRKITPHLNIPICRRIAQQVTRLYPKSFGVLDSNVKVIDCEAVVLTTTFINHNNYVNASNNITLLSNRKLKPKSVKRINYQATFPILIQLEMKVTPTKTWRIGESG